MNEIFMGSILQSGKDILILSRDLNHRGGVVDTVKLIIRRVGNSENLEHFSFGRRKSQNKINGYIQPLFDVFLLFLLLRRKKYDVIHVNPSLNPRSFIRESIVLILLYLMGYKGKVLIFFHGWKLEFMNLICSCVIFKKIFLRLLGVAGSIVVLSQSYRDSLIAAGLNGSLIIVGSTMFEEGCVPINSKFWSNRPGILFLSRIVAGKGCYELLEAFKTVLQSYPEASLIFAGEGPDLDSLMKTAIEMNISNVHFTGYLEGEDKKKIFDQCELFVLPTKFSEGCPVSLLEAMASGLVPVVPLSGGIADVVEPEITAVVIPEVTPSSISNAICNILGDRELFESISYNARKLAYEKYESNKVCELIRSIYISIAEGNVI